MSNVVETPPASPAPSLCQFPGGCPRPAAPREGARGPAPRYCGLPGPDGVVHTPANAWRARKTQQDDTPVTTAVLSATQVVGHARDLLTTLGAVVGQLTDALATMSDPDAAQAQIEAATAAADQVASTARSEAARAQLEVRTLAQAAVSAATKALEDEQEISRLVNLLADECRTADQLRGQLAAAEEKEQRTRMVIGEQAAEFEAVCAERDQAKAHAEAATNTVNDLQARADELNQQLAQARTQTHEAATRAERMEAQLAEARAEAADRGQEAAQARRDADHLRSQNGDLLAVLELERSEHTATRAGESVAREERAVALAEVKIAENRAVALVADAERLGAEVKELRAAVAQAREGERVARARIDQLTDALTAR